VNLYGPVRAADTTGSGSATVKLTFDAWKDGAVAATTHSVKVLPAKQGPKAEPVAAELITTLPHPDKLANHTTVRYSADGKRLFTAGYPSGVIQFWDVESKTETYRIETPRGYRGTADYALLSPDWKTLYVPMETRKTTPTEKDGKQAYRIEYTGPIRRWDLAAKKELDALAPPAGHGNQYAVLAPGGTHLLSVERKDTIAGDKDTSLTVLWDTATGKRTEVGDGFRVPLFSADGKRMATDIRDYDTKTTAVSVVSFPDRKPVAEWKYEGKDGRTLALGKFSPDGKVLACKLGGKKGAEPTTLFLDADTLKEVGRWVGTADPDGYGWEDGTFTPDGKRYLIIDGAGTLTVWDVAAKKVARTLAIGNRSWQHAVSPDGKWLAVGWSPKWDESVTNNRDPDPQDLPQPRVTLVDLTDPDARPRTLVAPHGYVGAVAFRPDGQQLAFGTAGGVHLFDLAKWN
jgi:WD40 repeat protein